MEARRGGTLGCRGRSGLAACERNLSAAASLPTLALSYLGDALQHPPSLPASSMTLTRQQTDAVKERKLQKRSSCPVKCFYGVFLLLISIYFFPFIHLTPPDFLFFNFFNLAAFHSSLVRKSCIAVSTHHV